VHCVLWKLLEFAVSVEVDQLVPEQAEEIILQLKVFHRLDQRQSNQDVTLEVEVESLLHVLEEFNWLRSEVVEPVGRLNNFREVGEELGLETGPGQLLVEQLDLDLVLLVSAVACFTALNGLDEFFEEVLVEIFTESFGKISELSGSGLDGFLAGHVAEDELDLPDDSTWQVELDGALLVRVSHGVGEGHVCHVLVALDD